MIKQTFSTTPIKFAQTRRLPKTAMIADSCDNLPPSFLEWLDVYAEEEEVPNNDRPILYYKYRGLGHWRPTGVIIQSEMACRIVLMTLERVLFRNPDSHLALLAQDIADKLPSWFDDMAGEETCAVVE